MISAPILLAALGGLLNEKSGIVNIGIEGMMNMGAFVAATVHVLLELSLGRGVSLPLALTFGALGGMVFSLIHAYVCITLKGNHIISGTGINLLASGFTIFFAQLIFSQERTVPFQLGMRATWLGSYYHTALIALVAAVGVWYLLNRRVIGLRLSACGEHPQAAAGAGINVAAMQYMAVLASGALSGLAGASMVLTQTIQYNNNLVNGAGFIALAAVSFGRWTVGGVVLASLLFGTSVTIALAPGTLLGAWATTLPSEFYQSVPYLITVISLVFYSIMKSRRGGGVSLT
jgi:ABC-type uncharacterized transport system permease subunit